MEGNRFNPFLLGLMIVFSCAYARADVIADGSAPPSQQPDITSASNGVPLVNIQTPSKAGVSRNHYQQFDVERQGVILNNAQTNVTTQLGGWVQGNPNLSGGTARVILNEINANDPSRLNGYVEVGGDRAQVVIANPAGITRDGCGFINANRASLTTGQLRVEDGQWQGYDVQTGTLRIEGQGLDSRTAQYTDLISQAVEVNAGVWAETLNVVAGQGVVSADTQSVNAKANPAGAPVVAIDVAELGGMYANSIRLVGNQSGVGVRNAGQIGVAAGQVQISADGRIENTGLISAGSVAARTDDALHNAGDLHGVTLNLTQYSLQNDGNIKTTDLTIAGDRVTNNADIDSGSGQINSQTLNNTGAIRVQALAAENTSTINTGTIDVADLTLNTASLDNQDTLTVDRATVNATESLANSGVMQGGSFTVATENLNNSGAITGASLNADTTLATNTGVVNTDTLFWRTTALDNIGSGKLYGDQLALAAATLNNTANGTDAPVIAARETLALGVNTLNNQDHGLIFSAGDLHIGGDIDNRGHAVGQANTLNNLSATIQAQGDMALAVEQIINRNEHLETEVFEVSREDRYEYRGSGSPNRYNRDEVGFRRHDKAQYLRTPEDTYRSYYRYIYTRTIEEEQVTQSDPARILAGGGIHLISNGISNEDSQILAGGTISGDSENLNNISTPGFRRISDAGQVTSYWRYKKRHAGGTKTSYNTRSRTSAYLPADVITRPSLDLAIATEYANVLNPAIDLPYRADASVNLPNNSLYRIQPGAPQGYLVETDPRFADYDSWLSSDYMLDQLGLDPALTQMRLGDGFYEQQLIREQMADLIGRRFFTRYADDEAQFRALMDSGVAFAQSHDIRPGIALTADQMNQLTEPMVWLVQKSVTLPDGNKVQALAPQLYPARGNATRPAGSLVAANQIKLDMSGNFNNSGTVSTEQDLTLSAQNINHEAGSLQGDAIILSAREDYTQQGADITANNGVTITANNNLSVATSTNRSQTDQSQKTHVDQVAHITVASGAVNASAGNDLSVTGAQVTADGIQLTAGNDLILGTVTGEETSQLKWSGDNHYQESTIEHVGSQLDSQGSVQLQADRDLSVTATAITSAEGAVALDASRDLTIAAAKNQQHIDAHTPTSEHTARYDQHALATIQSATGSTVSAGRDLTLTGSDLNSQGTTELSAGGDTKISAVVDTQYHYNHEEQDDSFGRSEAWTDETLESTVVGGNITSGGDLLINAHKNSDAEIVTRGSGETTLIGATLNSGGDIAIAGDEGVTISALQTQSMDFHQHKKSSTFGLEKTDRGQAAQSTQLHAFSSTSGGHTQLYSGRNLKLIAADVQAQGDINLEAVDQLLIAAGEVLHSHDQWSETSKAFSGGHVYESEQHRSGQTVASHQASTLIAGGQINGQMGEGHIAGSDLHGSQGIDLLADSANIRVEASQTNVSRYQFDRTITVGFGDVAENLSRPDEWVETKDGRATVKLANADYAQSQSDNTALSHRNAQLTSDDSINLNAQTGAIELVGTDIIADTDQNQRGDIALSAAQGITLTDTIDTQSFRSESTVGSAELSAVVQHQAVEVATAAHNLEEATEALHSAKREYKDYQRNLDQLKEKLTQLENDYRAGEPGITQGDLVELRSVIQDVKDGEDWYKTGIALAAANVASATTNLLAQTAAAAQSAGNYGFNAGLQLDIDAQQSQQESLTTTSVASSLGGENIRLQTDGHTTIRGSHLQANNQLAIDTDTLEIVAGKNTHQASEQSRQGHVTAQWMVYGNGGPSVTASFDRRQADNKSTTYTNSTLLANNVAILSQGDAEITGATVRGDDQLTVSIGGDLNLESQRDRASSDNISEGMSAGVGLNGGLGSVNGGARQANGYTRTTKTLLTSLTSGGSAAVMVDGHTELTGALIATTDENGKDLGQLNFQTGTLSFSDLNNRTIVSQTGGGITTSVGIGTNPTGPLDANSAQDNSGDELNPQSTNISYNNNQQYDASKTLATLGRGNITVGGTQLEQDGELTESGQQESSALTRLNRDTENTEKELWNSQYEQNTDVTIDNRMFTEDGREQIKQDYQDAKAVVESPGALIVDQYQQVSRTLAAMGEDVPDHLQEQLNTTGEQFVDQLLLAGVERDTVDQLLKDEQLISGLTELATANVLCDSNPNCLQQVQATKVEQPVLPAPTGELVIEITEGVGEKPLEIAVQGLGKVQGRINALMEVDPDTAKAVEMAIGIATGGPTKYAIGEVVNRGILAIAGEAMEETATKVTHYVGGEIHEIGEFGFKKMLEREGQLVDPEAGDKYYETTVDGIQLGATIVGLGGVAGKVVSRRSGGESDSDLGRQSSGSAQETNSVPNNDAVEGLTLRAEFKEGMDLKEFNRKINRVENAINDGRATSNIPHNISDAERRSLTRKYRRDLKNRIDSFYANDSVARENALKRLRNSDIDHMLDLQLDGQNVRYNLKTLDSKVNQELGRQFSTQLPRGEQVPIIRIDVDGLPETP